MKKIFFVYMPIRGEAVIKTVTRKVTAFTAVTVLSLATLVTTASATALPSMKSMLPTAAELHRALPAYANNPYGFSWY
jgi:hypothetical protein